MHPFHYPIPKLTIGFMGGVFLSKIVVLELSAVTLSIALVVPTVLFFHFKSAPQNKSIASLFLLLLFLLLGLWTTQLHNPKSKNNHYSHFLEQINTSNRLVLKVRSEMNPTTYYYRYKAKVVDMNNQKSSGEILISIPKNTAMEPLLVDDLLYIQTELNTINPPKNPYAFSYKDYMERKGIFHQINLQEHSKFVTAKGKQSIIGWASKAKTFVESKIESLDINDTAGAFLKAFYLGIRNEIPEDIKTNFKNAGVLHILALSGLHVGILLTILELLLRPIVRLRHGKKMRSFMIIVILWGFAVLTGLSPSIVRAVSMFSCFALAHGLHRPTNSINTLFISAFAVLLIQPNFLFDVGFQLSYTAVLGILLIKPILDQYWQPKHIVLKPMASLFNVSVAAQFGVLPLSLYYFHQFPALFFITNLLVIPLLVLCLWGGFFIIVFSGIKAINEPLIYGFECLIEMMNRCTNWVANFDIFLFKHITFDGVMLFVLYLIFSLIFKFIRAKKFKTIVVLGVAIIGFQLYVLFNYKIQSHREFFVFQKVKHTCLGFRNGPTFETHTTKTDSLNFTFIQDYITNLGIRKKVTSNLKRFYNIDGHQLLLVDSLGLFDFKSTTFDWVLLRNSPKIHLEQLINSLQPKLIIADGSNYKSFVERWKKTCTQKGVKFYDTQTNGAFIYPLN